MKRIAAIVATLVCTGVPARALDRRDLGGGAPAERTWKEFEAPASADEMKALGVDADLAEMMRNRTSGPPTLLRGADDSASPSRAARDLPEGGMPLGLQWPTEATASVALVRQLRDELGKRGLVVFVAERNFGTGPDHVALVQATEPAPVIAKRVVPPGMTREDWLARLESWRKEAPWDLLGVGEDWVEIEFRDAPASPDRWLEDFARIAPASLGDGAEGKRAFHEALLRTRRALLWWKLPDGQR